MGLCVFLIICVALFVVDVFCRWGNKLKEINDSKLHVHLKASQSMRFNTTITMVGRPTIL